MAIDLKRLAMRLRERICPRCVRYTSEHGCSLPPDVECFIFQNLGAIAEIVCTTRSSKVDDYLVRLRNEICSLCNEDRTGACKFRNALDCALDTYLPMIIDEIETELEFQRRDDIAHIRTFD